jgi:hypothetical protein
LRHSASVCVTAYDSPADAARGTQAMDKAVAPTSKCRLVISVMAISSLQA